MTDKLFRVPDGADGEVYIPMSNIAAVHHKSANEAVLYLKAPLGKRFRFTVTGPTIGAMVGVWMEDCGGLF